MLKDIIWSTLGYKEPPKENDLEEGLTEELEQLPGDNWLEKLEHCSNCTCCERHKQNRPRFLAPWTELPLVSETDHRTCSCRCRQLSRFICRQIVIIDNRTVSTEKCILQKPITETPM